jgi:hypothetical protein
MVRTAIDAGLKINTTGLTMHYYQGILSEEENLRMSIAFSELPPLDGMLTIMNLSDSFCAALLGHTVRT